MEDGTYPLNKILPPRDIADIIKRKPQLLEYIHAIAVAHKNCKSSARLADCDLPPNKITPVASWMRHLLDPPRLYFVTFVSDSENVVHRLTEVQTAVLLNNRPGSRLVVAQGFINDATSLGINLWIDGSILVSDQEIFKYSDGSTVKTDETRWPGGYVWAEEPSRPGKWSFEWMLYDFMNEHSGTFEGDQIIQIRDMAGRIFPLTVAHAKWTAARPHITSAEVDIIQ